MMSVRTNSALREAARDFMIVSAFAFWAVMIGFVPVVAIKTLLV
jgi:hypothetical protein